MSRPVNPVGNDLTRLPLPTFVDLLNRGDLIPAGPSGGPDWDTDQRAALWRSIESGWPLGLLVAWAPRHAGTTFLLDGHRRAATIREATTAGGTPLWRDVRADTPCYHTTNTGPGGWLPTTAMLRTGDFLHATTNWPKDTRRNAEHVANTVLHAPIDMLLLSGGDVHQVHDLCRLLLGARVEADTLVLAAIFAGHARPHPRR